MTNRVEMHHQTITTLLQPITDRWRVCARAFGYILEIHANVVVWIPVEFWRERREEPTLCALLKIQQIYHPEIAYSLFKCKCALQYNLCNNKGKEY